MFFNYFRPSPKFGRHLYMFSNHLRKHILEIFGPPLLHKHVFSTENKQKLEFSDPPFPLQVITYVIYEWSLVQNFLDL